MVKKIICLSASWCAPCKVFHKTLENLKETEGYDDIEVIFLDVEEDDKGVELAEKLGVRGVPTTLIFDENENVLSRITGNVPLSNVIETIDKNKEE